MSETDWRNIEPEVIVSLSDESNCDAYFATVALLKDESSNRLFFGFKVKVPEFREDSAVYGVAVRINDDEFVYLTPEAVSDYDNDKYSFEGTVQATSMTDFTAEVAVGVKYGLYTVENIEVRVVDSDGEPSNVYTLKIDEIISEPETIADYREIIQLPDYTTAKKTATEKQTTANKTTTTKEYTTKKPTITKKTTDPYEEFELPATTKKKKATTQKSTKTTTMPIEVYTPSESIASAESDQTTSFPYWLETTRRIPDDVETTVMTVRHLKIQKAFSYAAVAALILLALGICLVINIKHDKDKK